MAVKRWLLLLCVFDNKCYFSACDDVNVGKIEPAEVKESLLKLGVNIDLAEAERLTQRFGSYAVWCLCLHCMFF